MNDFVYDDFEPNDFVTEAPSSCDFVVDDFVNADFSVCVTTETGVGGLTSGLISRKIIPGYTGAKHPPDYYYKRYLEEKEKQQPQEVVIEAPVEKITDIFEQKINELIERLSHTEEEYKPIQIEFIPVRKTVSLSENKPEQVEKPKPTLPDIIKGIERKALKKKLAALQTLLHLTFLEEHL